MEFLEKLDNHVTGEFSEVIPDVQVKHSMLMLENLQVVIEGIKYIENKWPGTILDRKNKNLKENQNQFKENQFKEMNQKLSNVYEEYELEDSHKYGYRRNVEKGIEIYKKYCDGQLNSDQIDNNLLDYTRGTVLNDCYYSLIELEEELFGEQHGIFLDYKYSNLKKIIIDKLMEQYFAEFYLLSSPEYWDD